MDLNTILVVAGVTILAYWTRDTYLHVIAGILLVVFGFGIGNAHIVTAIGVAMVGLHSFWMAIARLFR